MGSRKVLKLSTLNLSPNTWDPSYLHKFTIAFVFMKLISCLLFVSIYCLSIFYHKSFFRKKDKRKRTGLWGPIWSRRTDNAERSEIKAKATPGDSWLCQGHSQHKGSWHLQPTQRKQWPQISLGTSKLAIMNQSPTAPKTSAPRRSCLPFVGCTR